MVFDPILAHFGGIYPPKPWSFGHFLAKMIIFDDFCNFLSQKRHGQYSVISQKCHFLCTIFRKLPNIGHVFVCSPTRISKRSFLTKMVIFLTFFDFFWLFYFPELSVFSKKVKKMSKKWSFFSGNYHIFDTFWYKNANFRQRFYTFGDLRNGNYP
jgi:hypothetical protein